MKHSRSRTHPFLTAAQRRYAALAAAVSGGDSVRQVARRFGVDPATVYRACWAAGIRFGSDGDAGDFATAGARHRGIAEAARKGEPAASIGKRTGYSEMTVRYACAKHGVRPVPGPDSEHAQGLAARRKLARRFRGRAEDQLPGYTPRARRVLWLLLHTDKTNAQIGREVGLSASRVSKLWRGVVTDARYR